MFPDMDSLDLMVEKGWRTCMKSPIRTLPYFVRFFPVFLASNDLHGLRKRNRTRRDCSDFRWSTGVLPVSFACWRDPLRALLFRGIVRGAGCIQRRSQLSR